MRHRWTLAGIAALAVVVLSGLPARARDPELNDKKTIEELRKEVSNLRKEIKLLREIALRDSELTDKELRLLNERMTRIEEALSRIPPPAAGTRGSGYYAPGAPPAGAVPVPVAPPPTGTLRLYNRMAETATVVVDGVAYNVPAFSAMNLSNRPAGPFTYQVTTAGGATPVTRSTINPNETLTVSIFPTVRVVAIE